MTSHMSKPIVVPTPKTRDPFTNTPLVPLGPGSDGVPRYWISTYNKNVGCTGVVVGEDGTHRLYQFDEAHDGFFSACAENADTLWLCGNLAAVVRLDLRTGAWREFATGADAASMHYGMVLDRIHGKLFAASGYGMSAAFSFDIRRRKPAAVYRELGFGEKLTTAIESPDGTWTLLLSRKRVGHWDPRAEAIVWRDLPSPLPAGPGFISPPIRDTRGRAYLSGAGWWDPAAGAIAPDGPRPDKEATWFGRDAKHAWGMTFGGDDVSVHRWSFADGKVVEACRIPDCHPFGLALSTRAKVLAVNMFGVFTRHDGLTGALESSHVLPVEAVGQVDCLCLVTKDRVLGTPYIAQRFWEADLHTGEGWDRGRAAPGIGEILLTIPMRRRVYMAAYTGGELVEYDPAKPARFPENPRVVAKPPGAMRPVSSANDRRFITYACNGHYGTLGSVLARYDTQTGASIHRKRPLGDRAIRGLWLAPGLGALFCGSTIDADTSSLPPTESTAMFARIDPETLDAVETHRAPKGITTAYIAGGLGRNRVLVVTTTSQRERRWAAMGLDPFEPPTAADLAPLPADTPPIYAGRPGLFMLVHCGRAELWDMRAVRKVRTVFRAPSGWPTSYKCSVQNGTLLLAFPKKIVVVENVFG